VITGISVALAIVALCFVGLLFVRVVSGRHAAKIGNIEINPQARAISPFTFIIEAGDVNNDSPSDTRRTGAGTITRRRLETQFHCKPIHTNTLHLSGWLSFRFPSVRAPANFSY
jgi:hypothetical protein